MASEKFQWRQRGRVWALLQAGQPVAELIPHPRYPDAYVVSIAGRELPELFSLKRAQKAAICHAERAGGAD
jgi:antitoxin (DNA-binding transcriptional repressor) of toxin-antitoxin stability system